MRVFFLGLCLSFCSLLSAQTTRHVVGEHSIVKDSTGKQYSYEEWQAMLQNDYSIKAVNPNDAKTEFLLVKLSEKKAAERRALRNEAMERLPRPKESNFFRTGERLTLFNTTDINGKNVNLKNLKGKVIVLNFWFINCAPCRSEIPLLNALVDSFKTNDKVVFVAVALDDKLSIIDFLNKNPFNYTIIDNGRFIANRYAINLYPTHLIVDPEGKVYFHASGLATNTLHWIQKSINELLEKKETTAGTH